MHRFTRNNTFVVFAAFMLACIVLSGFPALAAEQKGMIPDAEVTVSGDMRVGQPVKAVFDLKGYTLPAGSYASINVRFPVKPDGAEPKARTGYPATTLFFQTPGTYQATFILNEVSKPSCGGVEAITLLEKTVEIHISQ